MGNDSFVEEEVNRKMSNQNELIQFMSELVVMKRFFRISENQIKVFTIPS